MNERLLFIRDKVKSFWNQFTKKQKIIIGSTAFILLFSLGLYIFIASKPVYARLYNQQLSEQEVGQIKQELDSKQIPYRITDGGTNIEVPAVNAQDIVVDLAAQGIPKDASFSSEIFNQSNVFGITDRQFDVMKKDALQYEIKKMLERVKGVQSAQVILSLPEDNKFLTETVEQASASVIVNVDPNFKLNDQQVKALYHIVSHSVDKLPVENITITDQYSNPLEINSAAQSGSTTAYQTQEQIKSDIERKIQQNIYNLLGTIMGRDKVIVQTFVNMDFAQENREEKLVEPVDKQNNEGIIISAEKLSKTYTGQGAPPVGGTAGTGENAVPNYPGSQQGGNNQYEELQDRVNREVNRITKNVVESPYKIQDITINVGVEPPQGGLDQQTTDQIKQVLRNVVRVAMSEKGVELTQQQLDDHISVFSRTFSGKIETDQQQGLSQGLIYGAGALALLALAAVAYMVYRRRRQAREEEEFINDLPAPMPFDIPDIESLEDTDEVVVRKQLEKLARSNPDEFVVLLRTWLAED